VLFLLLLFSFACWFAKGGAVVAVFAPLGFGTAEDDDDDDDDDGNFCVAFALVEDVVALLSAVSSLFSSVLTASMTEYMHGPDSLFTHFKAVATATFKHIASFSLLL
jgi:hypothetical protein